MTTMTQNPPELGEILAADHGQSVTDVDEMVAGLTRVDNPIEGVFKGTIVSIGSLSGLPSGPRTLLTRIISRISAPIWRGKLFGDSEGVNLWLRRSNGAKFGAFKQTRTEAGELLLDYCLPKNPRVLRAIRGDLWETGAGSYLGRMRYEMGRGSTTLMYFTLER